MKKNHNFYLYILLGLVFLTSLIPVFHIKNAVGTEWRGIIPDYIEDSSYYYARVQDVVRGNPLIGNPYFIEHKQSISPAFFFSDWFASIPFILNLSFTFGVVFNIIFWSEIFVLILYFLFRRLDVSEVQSSIFSFLTYLQVFWLFVRPVAMQVIFPGYALFLLCLFVWSNDRTNKKKTIFLIISSLYCIYIYTYLAQIVFFTFALVLVNLLILKDWLSFKRLFKLLLFILVFSVPFLFVTYLQVSNSSYPETIHRIGLLSTHIPRMDLFFYGRWVVIILFLWFLSKKWISSFQSNDNIRTHHFFFITGAALLITAGSNVVTGKELELSNHIGRFITWWFPLTFFVYLSILIKSYRSSVSGINAYKKIILGGLILLCFFAMYRNIPRAFIFFRMDKMDSINIQGYAGGLKWLKDNISSPSVVWADDRISGYIPIMTQHYVLFHPSGALQMVSDRELEDRYLVSRVMFGDMSRYDFEKDVKLFGGAGKALKGPVMQDVFIDMEDRFNNDIKNNVSFWLKKYNVKYLIMDLRSSSNVSLSKEVLIKEVYNDSNLAIFEILP
ncbi:MAG: hypothetical protein V4690_03390 [Patescibacteria group bacterium]